MVKTTDTRTGSTATTKVELRAATEDEAAQWCDIIERLASRSPRDEADDIRTRTESVARLLCHVAVVVTVRKMVYEETWERDDAAVNFVLENEDPYRQVRSWLC